jgi:hypothetical protein
VSHSSGYWLLGTPSMIQARRTRDKSVLEKYSEMLPNAGVCRVLHNIFFRRVVTMTHSRLFVAVLVFGRVVTKLLCMEIWRLRFHDLTR